MTRLTLFTGLCMALVGCPTSECPMGTTMVEGRCVDVDASSNLDASATDANTDAPGLTPDSGADAFTPPDACTCTGGLVCLSGGGCGCLSDAQCSGATPACNTATNTCVPCTAMGNNGCSGTTPVCQTNDVDPTMNRCVVCLAGQTAACTNPTQPACDVSGAAPACTCTSMSTTSSCTSATAARCDETMNACVQCTADSHCAHLGATPACNEATGACVPCMPDNESLCAGNSCNPTTRTCTTTPVGLTMPCLPCIADSECVAGHTCAAVNASLGTSGTFCLPIRLGVDECPRGYFTQIDGTSSDVDSPVNYCRSATTTCEALLQYRTQQTLTIGATTYRCGNAPVGMSNDACGVADLNDGICGANGTSNRCTVPCNGVEDCPPGVGITCTSGRCSL